MPPSDMSTNSGNVNRARIATSALFAANALTLSVWVPRLAEAQLHLGLSDVEIGAALSAGAAGGLIAGLSAGPLMNRWSSRIVAMVSLVALVFVLPVLGFANGLATLTIALFLIGALDAVMDAAMNTHALRIQHVTNRSIINGFHGFWSLGAVLGGALGVATAYIGLPLGWTMVVVAVLVAVIGLLPARWLLPGSDPHTYVDGADVDAMSAADPQSILMGTTKVVLRPVIWALGAFIVLAVMIEDIPARWSSIYLTDIGTPAAMAGWGFLAFTVFMTISRFIGDRIIDAVGERRWIRISMATTAVVLSAGLYVQTPWAFIVASAVTGFGVATLFPAAMRSAAHLPGVRPAEGIAIVSWLARAGMVLAPLAVGATAEGFGVGWGIAIAAAAAAILVPLAAVLRSAKSRSA